MAIKSLLVSSLLAAAAQAQETVYGVYLFHRHGDRTAKAWPPANLTTLGYDEVVTSGTYFRNRYVSSSASLKLQGLSSDIVKNAQLTVTAPADVVLQSSALGFLQGLYPPVATVETLANGTQVTRPYGGYQLVPVGLSTSGTGSEDNGWLQDASGCNNAVSSSARYFVSDQYMSLLNSTTGFYNTIKPVVNGTYNSSQVNFKNAYTIFDLINVAEIHNASIPSSSVLTNDTLFQLRTLADTHEFGLAYNASDNARSVPGAQLAAEIVASLNATITSAGKTKLGIQFGAYASFLSFFGLANLTNADADFYGVPDYASVMVFELFANSTSGSAFPATSDLQVRFLFHNGTTSNTSEPTAFPLFGGSDLSIPWTTFQSKMNQFAIGTTQEWCNVCGNTAGTCAQYAASNSASSNGSSSTSGNGLSPAVNGVIGAMVTLAVVLGVEALVMLLGGFRLARKGSPATQVNGNGPIKA